MKNWIIALVLVTLPSVGWAQPHHQMVTVEATRVTFDAEMAVSATTTPEVGARSTASIGPEYVPIFGVIWADDPTKQALVVGPENSPYVLPPDSTWDAIVVKDGGVLTISTEHDTTVRYAHSQVLPGGQFNADVSGSTVTFTEIIRDVPLRLDPTDPSYDPFQWGNVRMNLGRQIRKGRYKTKKAVATVDVVPAGATRIPLVPPADWAVGDRLAITTGERFDPDTPIKREYAEVAALGPDYVDLVAPLQYAHRATDGGDRFRVFNLSPSGIILKSENPAGTPGHEVNLPGSWWHYESTYTEGIGRTVATRNLNNTVRNADGTYTHGNNQIARYASHEHHVHSQPDAIYRNNVIVGSDDSKQKWGHVIHQTSDTTVEDSLCVGTWGACFVTEDGPEVRNTIRNSYAIFNRQANNGNAQANSKTNPGGEGAGFWFRGLHQTIEGTEAWNNEGPGVNAFQQDEVQTLYPGTPGGPRDTLLVPRRLTFLAFKDVVTHGNRFGLETWRLSGVNVMNAVRLRAHNNSAQGVFMGNGNPGHLVLTEASIACQWPESAGRWTSDAVSSSQAYTSQMTFVGGEYRHCSQTLMRGVSIQGNHIENVTLSGVKNIEDVDRTPTLIKNVTFEAPPGRALHTIEFPVPNVTYSDQVVLQSGFAPDHDGPFVVVENWQVPGPNVGKTFTLFNERQLSTAPAKVATLSQDRWQYFCPEAGLTVGECYARHGVAEGHGVIEPSEVVTLEGTVGVLAKEGRWTTTCPARVTQTFPHMTEQATVDSKGQIRLYAALLCRRDTHKNNAFYYALDGGPPARLTLRSFDQANARPIDLPKPSDGTHTMTYWREALDGTRDFASMTTYEFFVGAPSPPPCTLSVSPTTATVPADGGTGTVAVTLSQPPCPWTATSDAGWLTVDPADGKGSSTLTYTAAPHTVPLARTATITVTADGGTQAVVVTQEAAECSYTVTPEAVTVPFGGGSVEFTLSASDPSCAWTAHTPESWVVLTPVSGTGNSTITAAVSANLEHVTRQLTLTIASRAVTITQDAAPIPWAPAYLFHREGVYQVCPSDNPDDEACRPLP